MTASPVHASGITCFTEIPAFFVLEVKHAPAVNFTKISYPSSLAGMKMSSLILAFGLEFRFGLSFC